MIDTYPPIRLCLSAIRCGRNTSGRSLQIRSLFLGTRKRRSVRKFLLGSFRTLEVQAHSEYIPKPNRNTTKLCLGIAYTLQIVVWFRRCVALKLRVFAQSIPSRIPAIRAEGKRVEVFLVLANQRRIEKNHAMLPLLGGAGNNQQTRRYKMKNHNRSLARKLVSQRPSYLMNRHLSPRKGGTCFISNNRYDPKTGCWNWTGTTNNHGYGVMTYSGKQVYCHRLSAHFYLKFDLKSDLQVLHRCDNPACFNPKHLFIGTQSDNLKDMARKGRNPSLFKKRTHCIHGHPLFGDNVCPGKRDCRTCRKEINRRHREKVSCRDIHLSV